MAENALREPFFANSREFFQLIEAAGWIFSLIGSTALWGNVPWIARVRARFIQELLDYLDADPDNQEVRRALSAAAGGGSGGGGGGSF